MSDSENRIQGKGFKGLQSLGSKLPTPASEPPAIPEHKLDTTLPPAWEDTTRQPEGTQLSTSQTAAPPWRGWVIGLGILGAIVFFIIWASNQSSSSNSYSSSLPTDYSTKVSEPSPATAPRAPAITMPPVGNGLVLTRNQIRYCVYEDRRIKGAEKFVNNYDQLSVDTFNAMVDDYNSRCSNFRYRSGSLMPIENEANQIQSQLEQEGRRRMIPDQIGQDAAIDAANAAAAAADAADTAAASAAADAAVEAAIDFSFVANEVDNSEPVMVDTEDPAEREDSALNGDGAFSRTYETSFDCSKARSIPEYLICHDPLLSADDRELAQLYQQAKASVTDSTGLRDRMRRQWNYREKNCRDKRCLSNWYVSQKDVMRKIAQTGDAYAN